MGAECDRHGSELLWKFGQTGFKEGFEQGPIRGIAVQSSGNRQDTAADVMQRRSTDDAHLFFCQWLELGKVLLGSYP